MLTKNQFLTLNIKEVNNLGYGVARADNGQVVFVSGAVEGDLVRAKIIRVTKGYAVARTEEVLEASLYRTEDFCDVKGCGGCAYRLLAYERELEVKRRHVIDCLRSEGLADLPVDEVMDILEMTGLTEVFSIER